MIGFSGDFKISGPGILPRGGKMKDRALIVSASRDDNFSFAVALMQKLGLKPQDLFFNQYNEPSYKTVLLLDGLRKSLKGSEG